jgi:hypothetical protein
MNAHVEITSIAMSKNDPKITKLDKYDVEANIEEVDNSEEQSIFKYGFTALSNPKNVRLAVEGIAKISGDAVERTEILEKDENDIPKILTMIYHELFPTFFLLSKTLSVSSPPHTIGEMGNSPIESEESIEPESNEAQTADDLPEELLESPSEPSTESPSEPSTESPSEPSTESPSEPSTESPSDSIKSPDIAQPGV